MGNWIVSINKGIFYYIYFLIDLYEVTTANDTAPPSGQCFKRLSKTWNKNSAAMKRLITANPGKSEVIQLADTAAE